MVLIERKVKNMKRFENGFDSYKKAIEELESRNADDFKLKGIIINFHHAIEVLFKHILCTKEKYLIYKDMNNWMQLEFNKKIENDKKQKEDYTIGFDEAVKRTFVIFDEKIDQYAYSNFYNLSKLRNALTHDEVDFTIESVEQIVVTLTPIVTAILRKNLTSGEKKEFDDFVSSAKYNKILQQLIGDNVVWRITTISDLLELYYNRVYDSLSEDEIVHLESTLSTLSCLVVKEDMFCRIDDEYYVTYISYLKRQICDLLIFNLQELKGNAQAIKVIKRTDVIRKIVQDYLVTAASSIWEILNIERCVSFKEEKNIHTLLDNKSFENNNDIFMLLQCIQKIKDVIVMLVGPQKSKNLFKEIYLDDSQENSFEMFNSALNRWFSKNNWFNYTNIKDLDQNLFNELESNAVLEELHSKIWDKGLCDEIIGAFGEFGTVDNIDGFQIGEPETIVKFGNNITIVYDIPFDQQTYFDHEFFDTGTYYGLVKAVGHMDKTKLVIDDVEYIGNPLGFDFFKFI